MKPRTKDKSSPQSKEERNLRRPASAAIRRAARLIENDDVLLNLGRVVVQEIAIEWRDRRISTLRGNGITVKERDGTSSGIIRLGTDDAIRLAMRAIADGKNVWDDYMTVRERREFRRQARGAEEAQ